MTRQPRKNPQLQVVENDSGSEHEEYIDLIALGILKEIWKYYRRTYGRTVH